ncbi:MAG: molybdate ABC transporter substrate-binding protein [Pseudomonadota bacterium]
MNMVLFCLKEKTVDKKTFHPLILSLAFGFLFFSLPVSADRIQIAVASNFAGAIKHIAKQFEADTGHKVNLILGSTGKHYAQIVNGAPFDAFFAADTKRPELLDTQGLIQAGSRFTYAIGKLVLWSPKTAYINQQLSILEQASFLHLAIASPKLAPYGKAAQEVLQQLGLWKKLQVKMVRGENINQAFQFVKSGNAELGFVAYSQIISANKKIDGSYWVIPQNSYTPINQQAVLLKKSQAAADFLSYIKSAAGIKIIHDFGYGTL